MEVFTHKWQFMVEAGHVRPPFGPVSQTVKVESPGCIGRGRGAMSGH